MNPLERYYLKLQIAEFSWSYGRGLFFGHYGLLLCLIFVVISGKTPKYILGVYWVILCLCWRCLGSIHI